ncbi:WD40-repeat-containing domain protein [Trichophaea hybrida]|nr:WD40-repeat-containing domain protein [Trichophaea hybrida]
MSRKGSIGSTRSNSTISVSSSSIPNNTNNNTLTKLHPCSASSEHVLYSQGSSILCLRHESLELERRFEGHTEDVTFISVDSCSDTLPSRVVSVDTSKTAIIWYLQTGEEISRFSSYDDIHTAAWMKNGNLAFGDCMGNVILFDPLRAESISARTIFDPLVAIAPSSDCKSFALGYNNGSVLIAALSPSFTILHTLTTTSISPSPIVTLAWHASSSKQKSDMLAVQTRDGDLRVWSVPKSIVGDESARVVRVLKRVDGNGRGINWLGWSRNGRIVQYSAGTTYIWDVRTKNVEWEDVPTPNNVFTLYPPQLLASFRNAPAFAPPSPPASIEEKKEDTETLHYVENTRQEDYMIAAPAPPAPPELPIVPIAYEPEPTEAMVYVDAGLGISNVLERRPSSVSSRSSTGSTGSQRERNLSVSSRGSGGRGGDREYSPATTTSPTPGRKGSVSSVQGNESTGVSPPLSGRKASIGAASHTSRKLHPLRQEMHPSPDTPETAAPGPIPDVADIFANLRARLTAVTYERPRTGGPQSRLSDDDLRKEMLFCIFGWKDDIEQLIGDELDSVNARSLNSLILRMWLGDLDQNSLSVMLGADFNVSGDWLFLALSAMGGQSSWTYVARAYVLKLLQKNDIHMAVLCLLAIGDKNDAVDVYVSHKCYL